MTRPSSIIFSFMVFCSAVYLVTLNRFLPISIVAQVCSLVSVVLLTTTQRYNISFYISIVIICLLFPLQGMYVAFLAVFFASYFIAKRIIGQDIVIITILFSTVTCVASMLHFYLDLKILYTPLYFEHYFINSISRLIGPDGSPAYLSFLAGISVLISLFFIRTRWISVLLGIFFLSIVLLTASRTAILGLCISLIFGLIRGLPFAAFLGALVLFPMAAALLYVMTPRLEPSYLIAIEQITSHRVVNWANLLTYFGGLSPLSVLFGIGKPPAISDAWVLQSETGLYRYSFVTYAESSLLKILVYHGLLAFIFFLGLMLFKGSSLRQYHSRVMVGYFVFSAIFYDAIFSVQYIYLSILFFYVIRSDHISLQKRVVL